MERILRGIKEREELLTDLRQTLTTRGHAGFMGVGEFCRVSMDG